jgi:hypothetical protein
MYSFYAQGSLPKVPSLLFVAIISRYKHSNYMGIDSAYSCSPYHSVEVWSGIEIFTSERSIRAEAVTYRLDGSTTSYNGEQDGEL